MSQVVGSSVGGSMAQKSVHSGEARYGASKRNTSGGIGKPAIWSLAKIAVVSPKVCCVTFWKAAAICVLTWRYQWPTNSAYACFTSAGTAPVAVAYSTRTVRGVAPQPNGATQ